ncbi:hypothetical protein, partial [Acidovorax sp. SUPP2522]|uniref:hypothetical protein n=1 Tax=Acidovorax sp. SUPP2522 TaxID=511900 RepID=UPI0024E17E36
PARPLMHPGADRCWASSRSNGYWRPLLPIRIRQTWGCERLPYEVANKILLEVPVQLPQLQEKLSYSQRDNVFKFFDSVFDGAEDREGGEFDLSQGDYVLTTELYKEDGQYEFIVHRFKKIDENK